jgi:hypothetical protein
MGSSVNVRILAAALILLSASLGGCRPGLAAKLKPLVSKAKPTVPVQRPANPLEKLIGPAASKEGVSGSKTIADSLRVTKLSLLKSSSSSLEQRIARLRPNLTLAAHRLLHDRWKRSNQDIASLDSESTSDDVERVSSEQQAIKAEVKRLEMLFG